MTQTAINFDPPPEPPMAPKLSARQSDLERLRRRLETASGPISMWDLRQEFPGGLTQRVSELKRAGVRVKCVEFGRVNGKRRTAYVIERGA
jgi:hypothetical protein